MPWAVIMACKGAQITHGIFRLPLKLRGQDLPSGVILKAHQSELGTAAFQPIVATGIGEHHHAEARARDSTTAISASATFLRRGQFGSSQNTPRRFAAERQISLGAKFLREMRIVEALILAARQAQDQLLLGKRNGPRPALSTIAMLHPIQGIGLITALQPLHLALTQLQQPGGFAYAQPPPHRIL